MDIDPTIAAVIFGSLLDTAIGDPYWMPHPIRLFGNMISALEKRLNRGNARRIKGAIAWFILCSAVGIFFVIANILLSVNSYLSIAWTSIMFFFCISNRCLIEEGMKVEKILNSGDLTAARKQLSMIVGRQTDRLSPSKIRSAVVETLSENLSDGVIAPLFYFAIGGIPLMMVYKMINTLDSMVGYKNDRYIEFGYFSAKMDDLANFIPARLTALLMVLASLSARAFRHVVRYSRCHSSPNSGFPESALSGVLDCRLGGPSYYFGKVVDKPYIGSNPRELTHRDVVRCTLLNAKVALISILIYLFILCL